MNQRKLDPRLCEAINGVDLPVPETFPVFVRLAPEASMAHLAKVEQIVGRAIREGQPTVTADVTLSDLSQLSDNPAVVTVRLSRMLTPAWRDARSA